LLSSQTHTKTKKWSLYWYYLF